jgi:integrase
VATPAELQPPTPAELQVLLQRLRHEDSRLHMFVVLAAVTGARRAQLLALRWRNVDLGRGRVSYCAGWVEGT